MHQCLPILHPQVRGNGSLRQLPLYPFVACPGLVRLDMAGEAGGDRGEGEMGKREGTGDRGEGGAVLVLLVTWRVRRGEGARKKEDGTSRRLPH